MKPVILLAALIAVAAGVHAQDTPLTPADIKAAWSGKKVFARSATGGLLDLHLRGDGTAAVSVGTLNDTGTWRLSDTGYCASWKQIRNGRESCFTVVRRGNTVYVLNPDQSVNAEILRVVD